MPRIHIETYYDIGCDHCGRHWSTDFNYSERRMNILPEADGMGMEINKKRLYRAAIKSGWRHRGGKTLCPDCAKELGYKE